MLRLCTRLLRLGFVCLGMAVLMSCSPNPDDTELFLVYGEPNSDLSRGEPFPFGIYRISLDPPGLVSVWTPPQDTRIENVRTYPELRTVLITEGYSPADAMSVFSMDSLRVIGHYDFDTLGPIWGVQQFALEDSRPFTLVSYMAFPQTDTARKRHLLIWPDSVRWREDIVDYHIPGEIRFSGSSTPGEDDGASFYSVFVPHKNLRDKGYALEAFPVPDSIVHFKTSAGWYMCAHEPTFLSLISVPERNGLVQREILIFDRTQRTWSSVLVPGDVTTSRPINGWIAGQVVFSGPGTDWVRRLGSAEDRVTDSAVIINPHTRQVTFLVAKRPEVLWIEGEVVYYRTEDKLCWARIEGEKLADVELILNDPKVEHFHWAFTRRR